MKKIIISLLLLLSSLFISFSCFSQETIIYSTLDSCFVDFKNREITTPRDGNYIIIVKERLGFKRYRMLVFKDFKYYDCILNLKSYRRQEFLYLKQIVK